MEKQTLIALYYSGGMASFSTKIPLKIWVSVYSLDMGEAHARVHHLALPHSWFSIPLASIQ